MSFSKISTWYPNRPHIDPRVDDRYGVGSKYTVVAVTKYPSYLQMRKAGKSIADARMVGLLQGFNAPQSRPIQRFYEIGSKYPYQVAGKFVGQISLSSAMFDATNIIGGIYEEVFREETDSGSEYLTAEGADVLNHPLLFNGGNNPVTYPTPGDPYSLNNDVYRNWSSIRMSIDDNRLDTPFGLVVALFQSSKRIGSIATNGNTPLIGNPQDGSYRVLTCLFFEYCRLEFYNFNLDANSEILFETASCFYTGLQNIKTSLQSPVENLPLSVE